ncbi:MAG: helix-turn-helix domain-containing protein [Woeseiaceae bacterium]
MTKTARQRSTCPIRYSLDLFGDRWTLLVLRDLVLHGKTHFGDFLASDERIASNILADRLARLECAGIITRRTDPDDRRRQVCRITEKGLTLTPVLLEIAAWGASNDRQTSAPSGFAAHFYTDRAAFYRDHGRLIAALADDDEVTSREQRSR